jgi:poly-beta-hydroxyalkanoate depolymerase
MAERQPDVLVAGALADALPGAAGVAAGCELFYRLAKQYEKPRFGIGP